jgi:DNA-binding GntR family transcriptional regulator
MQARVIDDMRRRIIKGDIEPGAPLSELALAEEFGVSRTPVREALKQLQTEGLVEIRPRVGTFVTTPSRREITELFEMKELLEGAAARLLARRGRVAEIDLLERNLREADERWSGTTGSGTRSWSRSSTTCSSPVPTTASWRPTTGC